MDSFCSLKRLKSEVLTRLLEMRGCGNEYVCGVVCFGESENNDFYKLFPPSFREEAVYRTWYITAHRLCSTRIAFSAGLYRR